MAPQTPSQPTIVALDYAHLHRRVHRCIEREGPACDLNHIDVSGITSMRGLFAGSAFDGNVSLWNVSNVDDFASMFADSAFNGDVSQWSVSKATSMENMFRNSPFAGDLSLWRPSMDCFWGDIVPRSSFKKMPAPSIFHWDMARMYHAPGKKPLADILQDEWIAHWIATQPLIQHFQLDCNEAMCMQQETWLRLHGHPALQLPLPSLDI